MLAWFTLHCLCKIKSFSHYIEMQNFLALICALFRLSKKCHTHAKEPPVYPRSLGKHYIKCYPTLLTWCCSPNFERTELSENKWLNSGCCFIIPFYKLRFFLCFYSALPLEINFFSMKTAEHTLFAQIFLVSTLWFI